MTRREAAKVIGAAAVPLPAASQRTPTQSASSDPCDFSALEQSRLLHSKKISARELLDAHLKRIDHVNPRVNAIVTLVPEIAREQASRADDAMAAGKSLGALHGLPVAHKDLNDTRGIRTTYGSRIYKDNVPSADSLVVERIRNAGAVTLGKTNTPEFGAGSQTFNEVFGATHNPYDLSKTCGGSSGGCAVALASGMIALGEGSDMGGSLRNPAAFCNVVGMRTAPGRVPKHATGLAWSTLSVDGPMARTVADLAFFLSVIAGPDARSPIAIAEPGAKFAAPLQRDFKGVRVAFWKDLGGVPFDPRVRDVVNAQRKTFEQLGCIVKEAEPDFSGADDAFKTLRGWSYAASYTNLVKLHRDLVKDTVIWEVERGLRLTAADLSRAETQHTALFNRLRVFFEKYAYFVLPTTQVPPFDINEPYVKSINGQSMETYIDWMKSCYYISITGLPAISVPAGFTSENLAVGLQIVGPHQSEWSVLQLAHAFEQATSVGKKRPALHG